MGESLTSTPGYGPAPAFVPPRIIERAGQAGPVPSAAERFTAAVPDGAAPVGAAPLRPAAGSLFDQRIQQIVATEGGYVNDPADRGGATNFGITEATARAFGYSGDMRALTRDQAVAIYRARFWSGPGFDQIEAIDPPIALKLLDLGITSGPSVGVKFLQRALNVLNKEGSSYPDITVDGGAGAITRAALTAFVKVRGREGRLVLLGMIAAQQSCYYLSIAETRPANERFVYGWQLNRAFAGIA